MKLTHVWWSKGLGLLADQNGGLDHVFAGTEQILDPVQLRQRYRTDGRIYWVKLGSHGKAGKHGNLDLFAQEVMPFISRPFILITSDGDSTVPDEIPDETLHSILSSPHLLAWHTQNLRTPNPHRGLNGVPIGLDLHTNRGAGNGHHLLRELETIRNSHQDRYLHPMIFADACLNRSSPSRHQLCPVLADSPHIHIPPNRLNQKDLWREYKKHKFVLSLQGNGLDCHRTWEALYLGAFVLCQRNGLSHLYEGLPVYEFDDIQEILDPALIRDLESAFSTRKINLEARFLDFSKSLRQTLNRKTPSPQDNLASCDPPNTGLTEPARNGIEHGPASTRRKKIILFYNTMWDQPLTYNDEDIPENFIPTTDRYYFRYAAAVVFHLPSLQVPQPISKREGQIWVAWTMECCEAHYPRMCDPAFASLFDLRMDYHPESDIFVSYIPDDLQNFHAAPVPKYGKEFLINSFISSPYNHSGRVEYLTKLMQYMDVHCYGRLLQNRLIQHDKGRVSKLETIARYKFTLAFENAIAQDYVTEKFYDPLTAGSVPVYLGAPNIDEFAPGEGCFINIADFPSPQALADHLLQLANNPTRYSHYLEWRQKPFSKPFSRLLEKQKAPPFTQLCRKVEERLRRHQIRTELHSAQ
ncbi:hypothetical protein F2Q65_05085 [Thiohalocapsa marina]|uniref:Uncharacterized protein n=1 Tax=Thiohalocapsa marina TaxID=424902 RepID=A0A5M8FQB9_9GAMM|nr:glycosyltransferase family 10 [Thiohalocapsa marina]KAA6186744.1 hypothetical protein F2Q65_05085 [Thiohalocapsa marina]